MKYILIILFSFNSYAYVDLSLQFSASRRESIQDPNIDTSIIHVSLVISIISVHDIVSIVIGTDRQVYSQNCSVGCDKLHVMA